MVTIILGGVIITDGGEIVIGMVASMVIIGAGAGIITTTSTVLRITDMAITDLIMDIIIIHITDEALIHIER